MKTPRLITCSIGLAVLVVVGSPQAVAQFEVDPDHYEISDAPPPQSKADATAHVSKEHYEGNFVLPYSLQCNRSGLLPGKYSLAVDSEGGTARVTVSRGGHTIRFEGITRKQNPNHGRNVLVVKHDGGTHQLSVIQIAQLDLVFSPALGFDREDGKPKRLEELPLILASGQ